MSTEIIQGAPLPQMELVTQSAALASVRRARKSLEDAAAEIVWQIEREVWVVLGYKSWDEMREAEYGGAAFMVPRKDRPELVQRMRAAGLTQQEVAATAGVTERTVRRDEDRTNVRYTDPEPQSITSARPKPKALPIKDSFHDATYAMSKAATKLENLHKSSAFAMNAEDLRKHKVDLFRAQTILRKIIQDLP